MNAHKTDRLLRLAVRMYADDPTQRIGQCFMNILFETCREGYTRIAYSDVDPFYDDARLEAAMKVLESMELPHHGCSTI